MICIKVKTVKNNEPIRVGYLDREVCVVILGGVCLVDIPDSSLSSIKLGNNRTVFEIPPDSIFVPAGMFAHIIPQSISVKLAIISADAEKGNEPLLLLGKNIVPDVRGKKEWQRKVFNILSAEHKARSLFVGLTIHSDGVWSGYPPHKHDTEDGNFESKNCEIYYVEMQPENAFAIFLQYDDKSKKAKILKSGDQIRVEHGYHAIVSAGGCKFFYLWAAESADRRFISRIDKNFEWVMS